MGSVQVRVLVADVIGVTRDWATGDLTPNDKGAGYLLSRTWLVLRTGTGVQVELGGTEAELRGLVGDLAAALTGGIHAPDATDATDATDGLPGGGHA